MRVVLTSPKTAQLKKIFIMHVPDWSIVFVCEESSWTTIIDYDCIMCICYSQSHTEITRYVNT